MKTDDLLYLFGLASLTNMWLDVNYLFFSSMFDLIRDHNEYIRQKAIEEYNESEDE